MGLFRRVAAAGARQLARFAAAGYRAASNSRALAGIMSSSGRETIDSLLAGQGSELRARVRVEVRENPYAGAIVETWQSEAIACGITPQSMHPDPEKAKRCNEVFNWFSDQCDPQGQNDFFGLQGVAFRAMVQDGEAFARFRWRRPTDGLKVPLQVQIIEADHLPFEKNETLASGYIINGVEFNKIGQRVAYHMYRNHPGQRQLLAESQFGITRVPADEIAHVHRTLRPGQVRGETWLARCLVQLHLILQYTDAELMRKKFAAFLMGFIEQGSSESLGPQTTSIASTGEQAPEGVAYSKLEPATLMQLGLGEKITISKPAETDPGYESFLKSQLKAVARAAMLAYHHVSGDLREVNFSSIRAEVIAFQRIAEAIAESTIVFQLNRPTWNYVMEAAASVGLLDPIDYVKNRTDYERCDWRLQRWEWVDPESDLAACIGKIRGGLSTRSLEVGKLGYDSREIDRQNAEDQERADSLSLSYDSDGRRDKKGGANDATAVGLRAQQKQAEQQSAGTIQ